MPETGKLFVRQRLRRQYYLDSVALMRLSQQLAAEAGVSDAALMMATPANIEIMQNAGLLDTDVDASPSDLMMAVAASSETAADSALVVAESLLDAPSSSRAGEAAGEQQPRSIRQAVAANPDSNFALISVPGEFAAAEASKAIRHGLNVMIFSDNVPVDEEVALKQQARALGCLVMGPDCGTAIIGGVPMAFANRVRQGSVGVVGASGTGIQEVTCLLDQAGIGISHAIGVGGRDLSQQVGGISTLQALDLLDADAATESLVLISKPPAADVRDRVIQRIAASQKPAVVCFIGDSNRSVDAAGKMQMVATLEAAAQAVAGIASTGGANTESVPGAGAVSGQRRFIRGLYCGGTLCAEAQVILCDQQGLLSNASIPGVGQLDTAADTINRGTDLPAAHCLLDLGADEFTRGKPHPMIEPAIRDAAIEQSLTDSSTSVVLLDCVLGYGSHIDPAGSIIRVIEKFSRPDGNAVPHVVASVTGTDNDPQDFAAQVACLRDSGVEVCESNAAAVRKAMLLAGLS